MWVGQVKVLWNACGVWVLCKGVRRIGVSKCERRSECNVRGVKEALRKGRRSCERVQGRKPVPISSSRLFNSGFSVLIARASSMCNRRSIFLIHRNMDTLCVKTVCGILGVLTIEVFTSMGKCWTVRYHTATLIAEGKGDWQAVDEHCCRPHWSSTEHQTASKQGKGKTNKMIKFDPNINFFIIAVAMVNKLF